MSAGTDFPDEVQQTLLRIVAAEQPIRADELQARVARETRCSYPFVVAGMWELVSAGHLHYDSSATVTLGQNSPTPPPEGEGGS